MKVKPLKDICIAGVSYSKGKIAEIDSEDGAMLIRLGRAVEAIETKPRAMKKNSSPSKP